MRWTILATLLGFTLAGCTPPDPGNGNGDETLVLLDLDTTGELGVVTGAGVIRGGAFDITDELPADIPDEVRVFFEAGDIVIDTNGSADTNGVADSNGITLLVEFADADAADPCAEGNPYLFFDVSISSNAVSAVAPSSATLDAADFERVTSGQFGLCLGASSARPVAVTVAQLRIQWVMPDDVVATSCAEVLALPEVQDAIADAASNGFDFDLPEGSSVPDLEGDYQLTQVVTFDPDGDNEGDETEGPITLDDQRAGGIRRRGFNASTRFFLTGNASTVGFCTVQRTRKASCDQTIARLEALEMTSNGTLDGHFISVAVRRHAFTDPTCGARGDYIFGDLTLAAPQVTLARVRGKATLPDGFVPTLLVVSPDGDSGTVTELDGPRAVQFSTTTPFSTEPIALPPTLDPEGFSALGISPDGTRLAVVTELPDAALIYDTHTLDLVRATATTSADYIGGLVDFDLAATRIFVPTTDERFADRITVLRADTNPLGDVIREFNTPTGEIPVQARLSPDGTRLAVLLEADAPIGEAAQLTFGNPTTGDFLQPALDLVEAAGGTALASELVFSPDSQLVFLAGLGAVVAVETRSPFGITRIDVSNGAGDSPVGLALSNDGRVLAVAIDDAAGDADFAVIDVATLEVLNRQDLPGIEPRGALAVAHFGTGRVAVVANLEARAVAVQTQAPFAAGEALSVAPDGELTTLGRLAAGGDVVAVTNIQENAVYVLELGGQ